MLDAFSRKFSAALLARYPEWASHIGTRANADGSQHLVVLVPRPIADDPVGGLAIGTAGSEVTVECGQHFHAHFDGPGDDAADGGAFAFVDRVLREEIVFARIQHGDLVLGGQALDPPAARAIIAGTAFPEWRGRTPADNAWLWSWRGTFDGRVTKAA